MKNTSTSILIVCILFISMSACSPTATSTPTREPTKIIITPTREFTPSPVVTTTPDIAITATYQANTMQQDMQKLVDEALIQNSAGKYYRVQDLTGEWAKLGYYHWWPLDRQPENFAIRADVNWEIASQSANYSRAGCGFVFHEKGPENLHFSFLSMDGYVRTIRMEKSIFTEMKANFVEKFEYPADSAKIMLVLEDEWITFLVNDKVVIRFEDDHLKDGGLSLAVASGTNTGFGTRCEFRNVELWEFN